MGRRADKQTSAKPGETIRKGVGGGYRTKPGEKPIRDAYQPRPTSSDVIVTPSPTNPHQIEEFV